MNFQSNPYDAIRIAIIIIVLYSPNRAFSQTPGPPSLAVGAGKVLYEKGVLDPEVISSIISSKQSEIKNELASRLILNKLQNESYVMQRFAKTNISLLLSETNPVVIQKEILKSSAELMLTTATLEFYLRVHRKTNGEFTKIIKDVVKAFSDVELNELKPSDVFLFSGIEDRLKLNRYRHKYNIDDAGQRFSVKLDSSKLDLQKFYRNFNGNGGFLPKATYIFQFDNLREINVDGKTLRLQNILLDLTYGVLSRNEFVQQLGLFAKTKKDEERNERDNYLYFLNHVNDTDFSNTNILLKERLKVFEAALKEDLNFLTQYQYILSQLSSKELVGRIPNIDTVYMNSEMDKILDRIGVLLSNQKLTASLCQNCNEDILSNLLMLLDYNLAVNDDDDDGWLYVLQQKLLPTLLKINFKNEAQQEELVIQIQELKNLLRTRIISNMLRDKEKLYAASLGSDILYQQDQLKSTLLKLINLTVNNFDSAETYDIIMNFIAGLGDLAQDEATKKIANLLINAGEKYITVQKDSNRVSLDVESMAVDLYKQFSENTTRRLSMYFSVGINYNSPLANNITLSDNSKLTSYAYVSEKIGAKVNLVDFARQYGYYERMNKPIIKDLHVLLFGSGLLYQIKGLSTEKDFSSPIVGLGLGVTFLNDLDLNLNYAFPIEMNVSKSLLNVSFDVKITEYLTSLKKSGKNKK